MSAAPTPVVEFLQPKAKKTSSFPGLMERTVTVKTRSFHDQTKPAAAPVINTTPGNRPGIELQEMNTPVNTPDAVPAALPAKKRGRPRKVFGPDADPDAPKRKPGRPRKVI